MPQKYKNIRVNRILTFINPIPHICRVKRPYYIALLLVIFASCQSKDGDFTFFSPEEDVTIGRQMDAAFVADAAQFPVLPRDRHKELYEALEGIRDKILDSDDLLHRDEFVWDLKIIQNDTVYNAFCTPGGFIYIYTGLLHFVTSEDELAGIIGHEIAHGDLRHGTDQMTKTYGLKVVAGLLTGSDGELLTNLGVSLLGLKFSRADESEADAFAVKYLSDTDYDPKAFGTFFDRMLEKEGSMGNFQFLSTHPNPENRIAKIETYWKEEGSKKGSDHSASFRKIKKLLP